MTSMADHDDVQPLDLSDYEVRSRREIGNILRRLGECKQLIQLRIEGSTDAIVTSVLAVDDRRGQAIIDCAPNPAINQRIIASGPIFFETVLSNIRILFQAGGAQACQYQNGPALRIAIPSVLIRLQRREFYRVATPSANPLLCEFHVPQAQGGERIIGVALQNISAGGIAVIDEQKLLNPTIGFIYQDCRIALPRAAQVVTALEIRNLRELTLANGKNIRRLGCRFVDLPSTMLTAVQRYITQLEREQNAKNTGML